MPVRNPAEDEPSETFVPPNGSEVPDGDDGDGDGDDDDDGDDGDDDDDDEPSMHLASVVTHSLSDEPNRPRRGRPPRVVDEERVQRPLASNPRGLRGPRNMSPESRASSPGMRVAQKKQEEALAELDQLLAGLNFKSREYEIRVKRLAPDVDENGVSCSGNLQTYTEKVTIQQIQNRYGGGTYEVSVYGPHPSTSVPGIIKRETFTIAGNPKPMPSYVNNKRDDDSLAEALKVVAETSERANERVVEALQSNQTRESPVKELMPFIDKLMSKTDDTLKIMMEQMKIENQKRDQERRDLEAKEERRRDEERRAEERRERERRDYEEKREARLREEREAERKREEERRQEERDRREDERRLREEERRAEEKREEKREQERREREREMREFEAKKAEMEREARREEAAERQRQHEREMMQAQERSKSDQERMREILSMQRENSNQMIEFLTAKMEGGGLEGIVKQVEALEYIRGDNKQPSKMEELGEGLQTISTALMPMAQQFMAARNPGMQMSQQQQAQAQAQATPQGPRVYVDLPQRAALPAPQQPQPQSQPQNIAQEQVPQPATPDPSQAPGELVNDFTVFVMPDVSKDDQNTMMAKLLKNMDLAIQRNMSAEDIVDQVLDPFEDSIEAAPWSEMAITYLQNMSSDDLLKFIETEVVDARTKAPLNWAIRSPLGSERIVQAFDLWKQDDGDTDGVPNE